MPTRTRPDAPRYDATLQQSVKNVFDRDPLLIPQLFDDSPPPWYRRRIGIVLAVVALLCLAGVAVAVQQFGFSGAAQWAGRGALIVLRAFVDAVI